MEIRTRISSRPFSRELGRGRAVVVGREALDDVGPVALGRAVDLLDALDAGLVELALQVTSGVGELGEDQDLLVGEFLRLEQANQLLQLVVVLRLELPGLVEELHDLVEVEEGLRHHLGDVVLLAVEALDRVEHLLRHDVLVLGSSLVFAPEFELALASRSRGSRRSGSSSAPAASSRRRSRCGLRGTRELLQQPIAGSSNAATELSNRLRNLVRIRPTTCFCRFFLERDRCSCPAPCTRRAGSTSAA